MNIHMFYDDEIYILYNNLTMAKYLQWDESMLQRKIEAKANNLFIKTAEKNSLQVIRYSVSGITKKQPENATLEMISKICEVSQINLLEKAGDRCQIFIVRHDRCWERLNVERELFEHLLSSYDVCNQFWRCVFAFGLKERENEFDFPRFKTRTSRRLSNGVDSYGLEGELYILYLTINFKEM